MARSANAFGVQRSVRGPWRQYLDRLTEYRPALHAYCRQLTGSVWDGEDLVQETLLRVFSLLGKTDTMLENPKAYLIRTATNLWIDRVRRSAREQAAAALGQPILRLRRLGNRRISGLRPMLFSRRSTRRSVPRFS